jgi:hypothetical protein
MAVNPPLQCPFRHLFVVDRLRTNTVTGPDERRRHIPPRCLPDGYNNTNYGFTPYNGVADLGSVAIARHPTITREANRNVATRIVTFTGVTGDDVCGFRDSEGFRFTEVVPDREGWTPTTYIRGLNHESAEREFSRDMNAMRRWRLA